MARNSKRGNAEVGKSQKRDAKPKRSQVIISTTVSIIGAGRLGTALAVALSAKGYPIEAVVGRRILSARRAVRMLASTTQAFSINQLSDLPPSKVLFITTPDDAIESVAEQLAQSSLSSGRGRIALHASGALSSDALISLRRIGFSTGSIHPLMSVSDPRVGAANLKRAHFCIEGQPQAVRAARCLVRALGGKSFSISTRDKALYHAAAVMSSGHMVALFDIASELLMKCGLTEKQTRDALLPLLTSTVENLADNSTSKALTGTFARADAATVVKHLAALRAKGDVETLATYKLLGIRSLELAKKNGATRSSIDIIKKILDVAHNG